MTFSHAELRKGSEVYVVDRVNQIAMATSLTGPEQFLIALVKVRFKERCEHLRWVK
jgi:hypothetical protein